MLHEMFPVADGQPPVSAIGWFDRKGTLRRLRADYANNWRIEIRLSAEGAITSSSASIRMVARSPK